MKYMLSCIYEVMLILFLNIRDFRFSLYEGCILMEMLSNDTYIQKTNKGSQALLVQPPITLKLRYYLHEIPSVEELYDSTSLIKVSQLYTLIDSGDPIDFSRTLHDMLLKGWIEPVSSDFINKLLNDNKNQHNEAVVDQVSEVAEETPIAETLLNDNEKELSEWLMEEKIKKEQQEKEEEVNRIKKAEAAFHYKEEVIPEIPWDSPYNSLEDFLNDNKPKKSTFKTDVWENSRQNNIEDSEWDIAGHDEDSSSSYSKTQDARYKEQLTLMKKEKRKKTTEYSLSDTEKSESAKTKNKGLLGIVGNLFNKKK